MTCRVVPAALCLALSGLAVAQEIRILNWSHEGSLTWSNSIWNTTCRVERITSLPPETGETWAVEAAVFTTGAVSRVMLPASITRSRSFYRVAYASSIFSGLAGYWPLDGDTLDRSTHRNHGTASGITFDDDSAGRPDHAAYFDGSGAHIDIPDSPSLHMTGLTLAFRFRMDSPAGARELVNKIGPAGDMSFGSEYIDADKKVYFRVCTDGRLNTLTDLASSSAIVTGRWYHFAGTYDGAEMRIYINGIMENSVAKNGTVYRSAEPLRIGRYGYYPGWVFHGAFDHVAIWNRALSPEEIEEICRSGTL